MATLGEITEGWTGRLGFTLLRTVNDALVPFALDVSWDVELLLRGRNQAAYVTTTGDVIPDPDQNANPGKVYVDFDADDLSYELDPYDAKFKITDDEGKVVFFPNGKADKLYVFRP